ncbi:MAG: amidohydrolase [Gammaproteobacteria bacterium]|nr:amidohydrolase [Gammaproteobacteria bacterium]
MSAEIIFFNGHFKGAGTFDKNITAAAIQNNCFLKFGSDQEILDLQNDLTILIDLNGKVVIPGLNDSHLHLIRGGLSFNMELRWDGITSLSDALSMLKDQARRTPPPQWVRVVGGWTEFQFKERRMPTLDEINAVSSETPVFIMHLYDCVLINKAGLRAIGYNKETKETPGTQIQRDKDGNPTGMLIAHPNAMILYAALAMGPKLNEDDKMNSTLHFMRELNRLGITSVCDAGGGSQHYPEDYEIIEKLNDQSKLTLRIAYSLFTQSPGHELEDFKLWTNTHTYPEGNSYYRLNGGGEMLVYSAADFEDFLQPRPDLPATMEQQLEPIVRLLAQNAWAFRIHATYDESISRILDIYERINYDIPLHKLNWFIDHAETISDKSIERVKKMGGGIAIQDRMAFQGEYFIERYGQTQTLRTPPIKKIIDAGIPVGMGTDATRVASYNPWVCLQWLVTGKTIGGAVIYDENNILSRELALELYTKGSAWFSNEQDKKGSFVEGQLADFAVLSKDYFHIPDEEIKNIYSVMTVLGGEIVHASDEFSSYNPDLPPVSPDWSPINYYGTYGGNKIIVDRQMHQLNCSLNHDEHLHKPNNFFGGCMCWAF